MNNYRCHLSYTLSPDNLKTNKNVFKITIIGNFKYLLYVVKRNCVIITNLQTNINQKGHLL